MYVKAKVGYDGTDYHGFQRQPGLRTVQGVLEGALGELAGREVSIVGAGRTDAGVHARGQVIAFEWPGPIPWQRLERVLLRRLPEDLVVSNLEPAPESFHPRFSAVGKCYRYTLDQGVYPSVFLRRYTWHVPTQMDLGSMRRAALAAAGTHDYTSFCAASTPVQNKVRTVYAIRLAEEPPFVHLYVFGNGFLYQMVRILVGTLVEVGIGKRSVESISGILAARDRRAAGVTAPAKGLTLWDVYYETGDFTRAWSGFLDLTAAAQYNEHGVFGPWNHEG
ncbi:tRNA pseudouridine(38-40) synthase TruA [Kyrpidia tusciae]|uniref:tRNA pseudouridine synthase A n=1 Tax=Kyrpidia tusciae (strain DSM 2912 / NBRC 15312 / T2) TaxID=562970 RepID=D5WS77_KYRT2|nr:tRNA pseudouridine(38-40) synthase TruA [Kyrpidia tusciae]ADG04962.1 tRNA pseudouridine synthase A [Kyrpidia tusciae DSM 2912]